ncbi:hypothetical protein BAUCODRAFT_411876 [Baudoinia panamericana UAMH 10762]|uniref:J domain-containing protein n=1 Tax=Baudoinia panamericana (strain UAMH 10762) TaxID=717646 RepID=M2LU45_BAUPA|nr:uncharacterized protein BAUCODRAFT_411876 [Baudoinia panamericana UAMH 10762]EMC98057.1 hypothetical protein BAUCODRAFT_411876 [Baudoinia panamericana UAMH 10762]
MASDDLKSIAISSKTPDLYDLLSLSPSSVESEIRRAYRKTALKYHPDKVGASDTAALDKFHLLQIAYDILSDPPLRELYNNARRAREEKQLREAAYDDRRRQLKEDLERRERAGLKRKRDATGTDVVGIASEEDEFERECKRIAADGARRRKEMEARLRREAAELEEEERREVAQTSRAEQAPNSGTQQPAAPLSKDDDQDRSITFRYPSISSTSQLDREAVISLWSCFGPIQDCITRAKDLRPPNSTSKQKRPYITVLLVYASRDGAQAAASHFAQKLAENAEVWGVFENVVWTGRARNEAEPARNEPKKTGESAPPFQSQLPKLGTFKGTLGSSGAASLDKNTITRMKNAQRRRDEERAKREAAAATAV